MDLQKMALLPKESFFDGNLWDSIKVNVVYYAILIFSLNIARPYAIAYKEKWFTSHMRIDGKHYYFDGTGGELFLQYLKWYLLSLITLGLYYSLFVSFQMKKWTLSHIHESLN
jgi:uncharacterized membrane protein YjgN (DUF898 family)